MDILCHIAIGRLFGRRWRGASLVGILFRKEVSDVMSPLLFRSGDMRRAIC